MGIVTTTSETAFTQSAETVYDFVTTARSTLSAGQPGQIDEYHAAVARELSRTQIDTSARVA